jgi:hypothetical protein
MYPYTKESGGVRSGEYGGEMIRPPLKIHNVMRTLFLQIGMRNSPNMSRYTT